MYEFIYESVFPCDSRIYSPVYALFPALLFRTKIIKIQTYIKLLANSMMQKELSSITHNGKGNYAYVGFKNTTRNLVSFDNNTETDE